MSNLDNLLNDLVIANRILANEDVVDAYGHVSVRHPDRPDRFFLARSLAPEFITRDEAGRVSRHFVILCFAARWLAGEGVPYVFRGFKVVGAYEDIGGFASGERWGPAPPGAAGVRDRELPAPNTVVIFPIN